ncbi:MAG TPA: tetratricopeptide repeat protein [Alphaproteobacteria bacterium]|jgi:hypothetical protein
MNESLPPDGRRVSYKSLDSEAMAAARRAAEASGISLQEWLSRTILENARRSGIVPETPSREVGANRPGQASAEEAVQAIARHLERAKAAADTQGLSLAEWLSRAILTNASPGDNPLSRRAQATGAAPGAPQLVGPASAATTPAAAESASAAPAAASSADTATAGSATAGSAAAPSDLAGVLRGDQSPAPAPRFRPRPAGAEAPEPALPEASSVRDVLSRGKTSASDAAAQAPKRRRSATLPLSAALGLLVLLAAGIWAWPLIQQRMRGGTETAAPAPAAEAPKTDTAALPEAPPPKPATPPESAKPTTPPAPAPQDTAKAPEAPAAKPPAARPPAPKPEEKADATPGATPGKPAESKPAETKPAEKAALPDTGESDLARVPAKDMPKPPAAHVEWYKKAAEAENPEAQYTLAELYLRGDGVPRSFPAAAQLFRRAAEKGNLARAQYALGLLYLKGVGVPKNEVEAVLWWQKAADQNFMPAITWVGLSLLEGRGIQKDEEAARKMLERAAEGDEPNAQYTLGRIYEKGLGTKKDPVVAMKWFILAAEQAHREATQKVEELSTTLPRDLQERATELVSEHYRRFRKRS